MRIGELARRTGLSRDTIRFYERQRLLKSFPSRQATNDYRVYSQDTVERLIMITEARSVGFTVADLRNLFRHLERMRRAPFDAEQFIDEKTTELRALIARSRRLLVLLNKAKAVLRSF